jgi:hypothetical protein
MPGYRDPPKHSQFKPGQSGNPKGGPRGPRRKPVQRRSTFLDETINCRIGGQPFNGTRRQAIPIIAALWSLTKPMPGSTGPGASEKAKLPKPNLALQQLVMKLADQEAAIDERIQRDNPSFSIVSFPSAPDAVSCIEDAADVAGFGIKAYHKRKSARVLLQNCVIEEALARFGDRRLTRDQQKQVLATVRFPKKVQWPDWWEPDLREHRKGWRAPQVAKNMTPPKRPQTIRMSVKEYMIAREPSRLREEELEYARRYAAADPEDREILRKPFARPGYKGV